MSRYPSEYVPPASPSPYLRAYLKFIESFNSWDVERILACYDDTLEHHIYPKQSLRQDVPFRNKEQYAEYMRKMNPALKFIKVTLHEVIEDGPKLAIQASSVGESANGTPYSNEYMSIVHFVPVTPSSDPDALPKICLAKEFVDSAFSIKFFTEEQAKLRQKKLEAEEVTSKA
ncbi:hypothetical protein D9613_001045 [Agrocybe pediades]|uniref:SnoaL-like domain-containing protein n=1 Tax=Agrocybe pediades TaxID=84607 RepID=A0A8H4VV51_9AGAR|nr:hypothetical protein D9613_001045 [Agrocybe pediades]KAF9555059.1 hypothetical protein CPC08DRAFT_696023 [Agrocybe pediades]